MSTKREKPTEGFNDVELQGTLDNSEFKRASVGDLAADYPFEPQGHTGKRNILEDTVYRDSATFGGSEILVAERAQKIAARTHESGWKRFNVANTTDAYDFQSPFLLFGQDNDRARMIVTCIEGFMVIGSLSELSAGQGFLLAAGDKLETEVAGEFYACISKGHAATAYTWWLERN